MQSIHDSSESILYNGDLTPNEGDDDATRLQKAKRWLRDNPEGKRCTAARLYNLKPSTLYSSCSRPESRKRGGHNKILQEHQIAALHLYIRSLLEYQIQPTHSLVYNSILTLKREEDPNFKAPSKQWFNHWWNANNLHKIKTKPIAIVRFTAQQERDIHKWFREYKKTLKEYKIKRKNIINFDESGWRIGCAKGQSILVPLDVAEVSNMLFSNLRIFLTFQYYSVSPENRRSLTIFECINATGSKPPPPFVVVEGKNLMRDWFPPNLDPDAYIMTSEKGFTTNEIAIEWLKHYIKNSDAGPHSDWKLLLMDNHGSHETSEFILLASQNNILPYPLLAHMTHCMQPLDVGVFQPYKHWHDKAINEAVAELHIDYTLRSFLSDLDWVRQKTFKKSTIISAFKKSGMYPPNIKRCLNQLKTFSPPEKKSDEPTLPLMQRTPKKSMESELQLAELEAKLVDNASSPSRPIVERFVRGTKEVLAYASLQSQEVELLKKRRIEEQERRTQKRKVVQKFGGLTGRDAQRIIDEQKQKEQEKEDKKAARQVRILFNQEKNDMYRQGVRDRKGERERKRKIKDLTAAGQEIPDSLLVPIPDREKAWKASQEEAKRVAEEQRRLQVAEEEVTIDITVDLIGDQSLQFEEEFIPIPEFSNTDTSSSEESSSDDSEVWGLDTGY